MPRHCSAAGCKSRDTRDSRKAGVTFHRLPKRENPRRALWILNSKRTGPQGHGPWDPQSDFIYFCSKHFTAESFELSGVSGYRRLKDDALPTVFEASGQKGRAGKRVTRGRPNQGDTGKPARSKAAPQKTVPDGHGEQQTTSDNENGIGEEASCTTEAANGTTAHNSEAWAGPVAAPPPSQTSLDTSAVHLQVPQPACDADPNPEKNADQEPQPPASPPRPPSPSRYMRRLPPPPGFYLPKEHSYAQLCPLVWRKQYDRAIDNLEKALRLLSAARRRENRLRQALSRLQESRLKNTLSRLRDGGGGGGGVRGKEARGGGSKGRLSNTSTGVESSELEGATAEAAEDLDTVVGEDSGSWRGGGGQGQGRGTRGAGGEDDDGCCFYCGRGRGDDEGPRDRQGGSKRDGRRRRLAAKRRRDRTWDDITDDGGGGGGGGDVPSKECYFYYCQTPEAEEDMQLVTTMELPHPQPDKPSEASLRFIANASTSRPLPLVHQQTAQSCVQKMHHVAGAAFQPTVRDSTVRDSGSSASFQLIQSGSSVPPQGQQMLLADVVSSEGQPDSSQQQQQQVYWLQDDGEGNLLLVATPASTEDGDGTPATGLGEDVDTQTIFVSDVGFQSGMLGVADMEGSRAEGEVVCMRVGGGSGGGDGGGLNDRLAGFHTNIRGAVLSGDVREKLKEHLEGFQLQLSNEFID
ncbi:THAP domain-containing protein 7 isoform X2 [Engraulis encrasicolus]